MYRREFKKGGKRYIFTKELFIDPSRDKCLCEVSQAAARMDVLVGFLPVELRVGQGYLQDLRLTNTGGRYLASDRSFTLQTGHIDFQHTKKDK